MFNKSKAPTPERQASPTPIPPLPDLPAPGQTARVAPAPAPVPAPARGLSTLSSDLTFEGNVSGQGDLQIDGQVKGDVKVGRLIIGETGAIEGGVSADYIEVRGRIVGAVSGKQVKLVSTAYVDGDITAEQLSIDIGAYFQGRVLQGRREAPKPAAAPTPPPAAAPEPPQAPAATIIDMKPAG
ncbi:MAG TPA: polymer-forming cytoskeletal protein [Brevundimonas sp.]|uniref:bactofilin family protein n=1 Tax=Brevundimonas sp. TaxID=1871086 RepID=UPI002E11D93C|nr:polymer-forming cytoskeletal protein [Brevundimonas sp.]